jgi:hypothetical protein
MQKGMFRQAIRIEPLHFFCKQQYRSLYKTLIGSQIFLFDPLRCELHTPSKKVNNQFLLSCPSQLENSR